MKSHRNVTVRLPLKLIRAANIVAAVEGISLREIMERAVTADVSGYVESPDAELRTLLAQLLEVPR